MEIAKNIYLYIDISSVASPGLGSITVVSCTLCLCSNYLRFNSCSLWLLVVAHSLSLAPLHCVLLSTHFSIPLHFADTKFNLPFCPEVSTAGAWPCRVCGWAVGWGWGWGRACWVNCIWLRILPHIFFRFSVIFLRFSYLFFILCSAWPQLPLAHFDPLLLVLLLLFLLLFLLLQQFVGHTLRRLPP